MIETAMEGSKPNTISLSEKVLLIFSLICTLATLGWVFWFSRYGIDFTDESFYLVWISNPYSYSASVTQFGFIYHPLYDLFDGNIAELRQANIIITFSLAFMLGNTFLKTIFGNQIVDTKQRLILAAALATTSLTFLISWLPTPSYNSLALQALLVVATGYLQADQKVSYASISGWLLIGIGGWLAFMAKPTTAAALGVCSLFYILLARKLRINLLIISLVTALCLFVISALIIDGSVPVFIGRLSTGHEMSKILADGYSISQLFRVDSFSIKFKALLIVSTILIASAAYCSQAKKYLLKYIGNTLSAIFVLFGIVIIFGVVPQTLNAGNSQGLLIWSVPLGAILAGFVTNKFKGLFQISMDQWALAFCFLLFPHVYAFGTNNNYWYAGTSAAIFWFFAGLILLSPTPSGRKFLSVLLPIVLAAQAVTVALIQIGIEEPYRQPQSLRDNDYTLEVGRPGSELVLSNGFGHYIEEAVDKAKQAGFKIGTPVIDLTGQSPGILYAIGAKNIGQAWMIGGYPGSEELAVSSLKNVSCQEISIAWLLAEPEGPRKIPQQILSSFAAIISVDYEIVGTFRTAEGAGGYNYARIQQILKPVRSIDDGLKACAGSREIKE